VPFAESVELERAPMDSPIEQGVERLHFFSSFVKLQVTREVLACGVELGVNTNVFIRGVGNKPACTNDGLVFTGQAQLVCHQSSYKISDERVGEKTMVHGGIIPKIP
jgi:hypothetical protein